MSSLFFFLYQYSNLHSSNRFFPDNSFKTSPDTIGTPAGVNLFGINPIVSISISRYFLGFDFAAVLLKV